MTKLATLRQRTRDEEASDWDEVEDEHEPHGVNFKMRRMCVNCPFRKHSAIPLHPGRLKGIVKHLENDYNYFPCHKTTHGAAEEESVCMGSLAYGYRYKGRLPVIARIGVVYRELKIADIEANYPELKEPKDIK